MENNTSFENSVIALIASRAKELSPERYTRLLSVIGEPRMLLNSPKMLWELDSVARKLANPLLGEQASRELKSWEAQGIFSIALGDPLYPQALAQIYDPPRLLFFKGRHPVEILASSIAVIGSRKADHYCTQFAQRISAELSQAGNTVVSGLALGIDTAAHQGALQGAGKFPTVAVMGSGLQKIYPPTNLDLSREIVEKGGTLISQFEPEVPPLPHNFLNRNRTIAGLSSAVLVVQAAKRSGSLATARFAMESSREVLVAPGAACDPRFEGSFYLLRQGAVLAANIEHICDSVPVLNRPAPVPHSKQIDLPEGQKRILGALSRFHEVLYDDLKEAVNFPGFATHLLELELAGLIQQLPGNRVSLSQEGRDAAG